MCFLRNILIQIINVRYIYLLYTEKTVLLKNLKILLHVDQKSNFVELSI